MKKLMLLIMLFMLTFGQCFAMSEKVYNEFGERVGTARKNGDTYEWYDMDGKRVKSYKDLSEGGDVFVGVPGRQINHYHYYNPYAFYHNYPYNYKKPNLNGQEAPKKRDLYAY